MKYKFRGEFWDRKRALFADKIKAKNPQTEKVWLFFGIHTANAVKIAKRRKKGSTLLLAA